MTKIVLLLLLFIYPVMAGAQDTTNVVVPHLNDAYSKFGQRLESGDTTVDFTAFRESFLKSRQYESKQKQKTIYDSLAKLALQEIRQSNFPKVIVLAKRMLSIDYTSITAHSYLQKSYDALGDSVNRDKYDNIAAGLLNSIVDSGDGKTCATGWQVISTEEEYFVLGLMGATNTDNSIAHEKNNTCDKMTIVSGQGAGEVYYFVVNKIFEQYERQIRNGTLKRPG